MEINRADLTGSLIPPLNTVIVLVTQMNGYFDSNSKLLETLKVCIMIRFISLCSTCMSPILLDNLMTCCLDPRLLITRE